MTRLNFYSFFASVVLGGCAAAPDDVAAEDLALDDTGAVYRAAALGKATAAVAISAEPGGSCELACFDVESSKDVGFIAVDATRCGEEPVELSLYAVDASGTTPVDITPAPHGNGKSCSDIPPFALKFDDLSGRHLVVCTAGAESASVFVKSGKTCAARSFDIDVEEQCDPDTPDWGREMGSAAFLGRSDVATDPEGNVLFAGDGVEKLDGSGETLWTFSQGARVASDSSGNVIVAGTFATTIDLGFGPMVPTEDSADVFVAKLDRGGHPIWIKVFGTSANEYSESVATDGIGNIGLGITGMGTLKLHPNGQVIWTKTFSGTVAFDASGNLAVTGGFIGSIDVGNGPVESTGPAPDAFVVKLDSDGNHVWSHMFGDATTGSQVGTSVAFDRMGNVLIVGEVHTSIRLFGTDYLMPPPAEYSTKSAYIAKIDPSGEPLWARVRYFTEDMLDVAADSAGNIYVTGGDVGNVLPLRYNFVEMLDESGVTQWKLGSMTSEWPGLGRGNAVTLDACDNLYWSLWQTSGGPYFTSSHMLAKVDRYSASP